MKTIKLFLLLLFALNLQMIFGQTTTIDQVVYDMAGPVYRTAGPYYAPWGKHEGVLENGNTDFAGYDWFNGAKPGTWMQGITSGQYLGINTWGQAYPEEGYIAAGKSLDFRIQIRNLRVYALRNSSWDLIINTPTPQINGGWGNYWYNFKDAPTTSNAKDESSNGGGISITMPNDRMVHWWDDSWIQNNNMREPMPTDAQAVVCYAEVRLIQDPDRYGDINLDNVKVLVAEGMDTYTSRTEVSSGYPISSAGIPRHKYITSQWKSFTMYVVGNPVPTTYDGYRNLILNKPYPPFVTTGTNYTLTVISGSGSGSYSSGTNVSITANAAPSGQVFDKWTGSTAIANIYSASTTIAMPAAATTITATYKTVPVDPTNLLLNGGFEGSSSWSINNTTVYSISTADKRSGSSSLRMVGTTSWGTTHQVVTVTSNTDYFLKAWLKGTAKVQFRVGINPSWALIKEQQFTPISGSWTEHTMTFNSGNNTQLVIAWQDAGSGTTYIDDATLSGGTTPPATYALTVNSGSGSGSYVSGTVVNISANSAPAGQTFDKWTGSTAIANLYGASTTITMPAAATSITATYKATISQRPVDLNGRLRVSGNKIVNENGQVVSLFGMSLTWSTWGGEVYWNKPVVDWLVQDWKIDLIRAAMAVDINESYQTTAEKGWMYNKSGQYAKMETIVQAAIDNGIYVLVDWHCHNLRTNEAKEFFGYMAQKYGNVKNIIWETYNEPLEQSWSELSTYHNAVTSVIRQYSQNLIVAGTRTWSQRVDEAANNPLPDNNTAYTLHFYAGTHGSGLRDIADYALNEGIALFITEWGTSNADGGISDKKFYENESNTWLNWALSRNLSMANWSVVHWDQVSSILKSGASTSVGWNPTTQLTRSGIFVRNRTLTLNANKNYKSALIPTNAGESEIFNSRVFPNPVNNEKFTIEFDSENQSNEIFISDLSGRVVFRKSAVNERIVEISTCELNGHGMFFITIRNGGKIKFHKLVFSR
jgi:endoglucanase